MSSSSMAQFCRKMHKKTPTLQIHVHAEWQNIVSTTAQLSIGKRPNCILQRTRTLITLWKKVRRNASRRKLFSVFLKCHR